MTSGKNNSDRFVLVLFYNSSQSIKQIVHLNYQIELILNKFQNNACKGASEIEYITISTDSDYNKWKGFLTEGNLLSSKFKGKKSNFLVKNGVNDKSVKGFAVTKYPSFFVINP